MNNTVNKVLQDVSLTSIVAPISKIVFINCLWREGDLN